MLTDATLERYLSGIPRLTVCVLGDLFLDRYLDLDAALTEPSLETGLDAYQVVRVRPSPGAAGTVVNNLAALGVGRILPVAVIGDDGEGCELRQSLGRLPAVDAAGVIAAPDRRTPTYTKPMLHEPGRPPRELNRLDIKNRTPLPPPLEDRVLEALRAAFRYADAIVVLDQVSEEDCGVVTARVREELARLAELAPTCFMLADSRERIGRFRSVCLKPNSRECLRAVSAGDGSESSLSDAVLALALRADAVVFCTHGDKGIWVAYPDAKHRPELVPAYPVSGPIDPVGAGDSTSAGIACAIAAGASPEEAAAFGNLVASITIQQLGTTGTASPEQVRSRWREIRGATP
jgi:bifunctional ADP-heptose synthase (sugar kinase/adenylyltransferase)